MNRTTILSLATAFSIAATAAIAGPAEHGGHHEKWGGPGKRLERQLESLDLTAEQKTTVDKLLETARERNEKDRVALREGYEKLHEMLDAETPDEKAILDQVEKLGEIKTEGQKATIRTMLSIRSELTPEQREKLKAQMKEQKQRRMERMKEHRERQKKSGDAAKPSTDS